MKAFKLIDSGCPSCGVKRGVYRGLQYHSLSVWCLRCGWAANWSAIVGRIDDSGKLTNVHGGLADG